MYEEVVVFMQSHDSAALQQQKNGVTFLLARGKIPFYSIWRDCRTAVVSQDGCIFFLGQRERKEMESRFSSLFV